MLRAEDITVKFGGLTAVDHVTLALHEREFVGLVGPNGAGKSTLLNAIAGAVPTRNGRVFLHDKEITHVRPHRKIQNGLGRTFQHPALFESLTVRENLEVGSSRAHRSRGDASSGDILELLDLGEVADAPTADLPYGVKKLVDVARTLMLHPKVLLLDEPGAGLNSAEKKHLSAVLVRAQHAMNWAAVVVEHDIAFVSALVGRVVVLNYGQLLADDSPEAVWRNPEVVAAYLGVE